MDIFKPPTDNLYKFVFIVSIVAILNSIYQINKLSDIKSELITAISDKSKEISSNRSDYLEELKKVSSKSEQILKWYKGLNREFNSYKDFEKELNFIEKENEKIKAEREEIIKRKEVKDTEISKTEKESESLKNELYKIEGTYRFHYFVIGLFTFFAVPSFLTWFKQQRFNDKILEKSYFAAKNYYANCQSCNCDITEEFDEKNPKKFCTSCYSNGEFNEPDISLEEFKNKLNLELKAHGKNKLERMFYLGNLDSLERWSPKFKRPQI